MFADDTCIFHSNYKKLEDEINTSLDNIANWLKANNINVKKSNIIVFKVACVIDIMDWFCYNLIVLIK